MEGAQVAGCGAAEQGFTDVGWQITGIDGVLISIPILMGEVALQDTLEVALNIELPEHICSVGEVTGVEF
jgi:hypothetical protein